MDTKTYPVTHSEAEWRKVAAALGLGTDWRAALERIKRDHVDPGAQPALIAEQAYEAIDFVTQGLVLGGNRDWLQ